MRHGRAQNRLHKAKVGDKSNLNDDEDDVADDQHDIIPLAVEGK